MPSKFLDQVLADDPVDLGPGWEMDRSDRRFIDDQIQAMQQQMLACLLRGIVATWMRLDAGSATGVAGDIVCASPSTNLADTVLRATVTPLAAAGGGAFGMLLNGTRPGALGLVALRGIVSQKIHGLNPGSPGVVRVNTTTARGEYVTTLGVGDIPVGQIDSAGNITLSFASQAGGAGPGAITPTFTDAGTSNSASPILVRHIDIAANSVTRFVVVTFARNNGTLYYKKKSSTDWSRSGTANAVQIGTDDGPFRTDNIGFGVGATAGMTIVGNGIGVDIKWNPVSISTSYVMETYLEALGLSVAP